MKIGVAELRYECRAQDLQEEGKRVGRPYQIHTHDQQRPIKFILKTLAIIL